MVDIRRGEPLGFVVNGQPVEVADDGSSLLDVLRGPMGVHSVKDGCSPQGQCGCCTVLVDGEPRVACVTPARRVAGRHITTVEGLDDAAAWAGAFVATGGSQCGFCTPGIIMRLSGLRAAKPHADEAAVERALLAHLCRCTGWRTIVEAWDAFGDDVPSRDFDAASRRASIEGRSPQRVGAEIALGRAGFADDVAPDDALVAMSDGAGGWAVAGSVAEARRAAAKVQGRRTSAALHHPIDVPAGDWDATLQTTWVEPAYLETDASWCEPGGEPATALANGGAFGGKVESIVGRVARALADEHGRAVRVLLSREDAVRWGVKRPPIAGGVRDDATGVLRVARTRGIGDAINAFAPSLRVEEVDVAGPPTSCGLRAAGWAEAALLLAAVGDRNRTARVTAPSGAHASASIGADGTVHVEIDCGAPLDEVIVRSYCVGAAHMALGWVTSEGIAVTDDGEVADLTIRSFGVLRAVDTPPVEVDIVDRGGEPVNGSDAVFAAVAAAAWVAQGCPPQLPTGRRLR